MPLIQRVTRRYLDLCLLVLLVQALVGVLGFYFHLRANLAAPGISLFDKFVNGAPPMAPLLFPNLVGLAFIGIWTLTEHLPEGVPGQSSWLGAAFHWFHPDENLAGAPIDAGG